MAVATKQEITLHLPQDVVEMLWKAVTARRETPDQIVAEALRFSLQPVRQEALQRLNTRIRQQSLQPEPEVCAHLEAHLATREEERLSLLLERNRTEGLVADEQAELQRLFDKIEAVATEKAAAIWLLSGQISHSTASS